MVLMANNKSNNNIIVSVRERRPTGIAAAAASAVVAIFSIRYSHILSCEAKPAVMMMLMTVTVGMMMGIFLHL